MEENCSTELIAKTIREYAGVRRKHDIGGIVQALRLDCGNVAASFGEDAALIINGDDGLLLAADGIWSMLMEADAYWAGFCAVLVNVHDIAAMGGKPLAMVDILSAKDDKVRSDVLRGMADAARKLNVPIVGGHLHPDSPFSAVDIAILGTVNPKNVLLSGTAKAGDKIIAAFDLNGRVHPSCALNWDSATIRSAEELRAQIAVMYELAEKHLLTAGKDISNPGVIGTLGMLLETSGRGGVVDLEKIPKPDIEKHGIPFSQWVRMYPGMGFIMTAEEKNAAEVISLFEKVGMTAAVIGDVNAESRLVIRCSGQESVVFDFAKDGVVCIDNADKN